MEDKRQKERNEKSKMAVLTAECDRMFSVDKDQSVSFKSVEGNKKIRQKADVAVSKISTKIIVETGFSINDKA